MGNQGVCGPAWCSRGQKDSCPVHPRTYDTITKLAHNVWLSHLHSERVQCTTCTRSWIQKATFTLVKSKRTLLKLSGCTTSSTIRKLQTTKDRFHPPEFYVFVQYMDRPSSGDRSTSSCSKTWPSCTRSSTMTMTLTDDFVTRLPLIWRQRPVQTNNTLLPTRSVVFSCLLLLSARLPRSLHPPGRLSAMVVGCYIFVYLYICDSVSTIAKVRVTDLTTHHRKVSVVRQRYHTVTCDIPRRHTSY